MSFTKLSSTIVFSTVWREPNHVRIVWITMLALADARGCVWASLPGLADAARVSLAECEAALAAFQAPDPYSRTKDYEGRRIEVVDGGWRLLNHELYRSGRDAASRREQNREAQARFRERQQQQSKPRKPRVSRGQPESAQAEAEAEAEADSEADRDVEPQLALLADPASPGTTNHAPKQRKKWKPWRVVPADWQPNDEHRRIAIEEGKDFARELKKFRDHEYAKAKTDPDRCFRSWLRNDFGGGRKSNNPGSKQPNHGAFDASAYEVSE